MLALPPQWNFWQLSAAMGFPDAGLRSACWTTKGKAMSDPQFATPHPLDKAEDELRLFRNNTSLSSAQIEWLDAIRSKLAMIERSTPSAIAATEDEIIERCAKVADRAMQHFAPDSQQSFACSDVAQAIRAMKAREPKTKPKV
jgi:hypothetical protein